MSPTGRERHDGEVTGRIDEAASAGTLFIVPTPIGNLEDITLRAVSTLTRVRVIAAEDTRRTRGLLTHFDIRGKKLISYHQHSKLTGIARVVHYLADEDVALVSDAGMPAIGDPGFELIRAAVERGIRVEVLPGPSAVTTAVPLAALPARGFIFMGFLPRRKKEAQAALEHVADLPYALVLFEAPVRLAKTLDVLREHLGDRAMVAVREISKVHEEAIRGMISDVRQHVAGEQPRGEWTLVVGGGEAAVAQVDGQAVVDAVARLVAAGHSARDAISAVARAESLPRSRVYRLWQQGGDQPEFS